jgi:hypothetical protein
MIVSLPPPPSMLTLPTKVVALKSSRLSFQSPSSRTGPPAPEASTVSTPFFGANAVRPISTLPP